MFWKCICPGTGAWKEGQVSGNYLDFKMGISCFGFT